MLNSWTIFVQLLNKPSQQPFCLLLHRLCECYGGKPHEYLFNDLQDCAHTRLVIDLAVLNHFLVAEQAEIQRIERSHRKR